MHAVLLRAPIAEIHIHHLDESVVFSVAYFDKKKGNSFGEFTEDATLQAFSVLNDYWSRLNLDTQAAIFTCYKQIRSLLNLETTNEHTKRNTLDVLQRELRLVTEQLTNYHTYEALKHHVDYYTSYYLPDDIPESFETNTRQLTNTLERTYIQSDYKDLVLLSLALRPVAVYWGEYIDKIESVVATEWKELNAYYLLVRSWIYESVPLQRLTSYTQATLEAELTGNKEDYLAPAVIEGIGIDDFPKWLLAQVVVKRVAWVNYTLLDRGNIVKEVYRFLRSKVRNKLTGFKSTVNNKDTELDVTDGSKMSLLESYRSRMDLALGEITLAEHTIADPVKLALQLEPTLDLRLLQQALALRETFHAYPITDVQVRLMQWTVNTILPARMIPYLDKQYIITLLVITAAILYHRGFPSLAVILIAYPIPRPNVSILADALIKPSSALIEEVNKLYPYRRKLKPKINPVLETMERVHRDIQQTNWYTLVPEEWLDSSLAVADSRQYAAQRDLKVVLLKFIVDLNERIKNELPNAYSFPDGSGI